MNIDNTQFESVLVARDRLADGTEISTVRLAFGFYEPTGYAFETCVFYPNGDNSVVARWHNIGEARRQHRYIVDHEDAHLQARERRVNC